MQKIKISPHTYEWLGYILLMSISLKSQLNISRHSALNTYSTVVGLQSKWNMDHRDLACCTRVPLIRTEYLITLQPVPQLTFLKSFQHCPLTFALFNGIFYSARTRLTNNRVGLKWTGSKAPTLLPGSDFWVSLPLFLLPLCFSWLTPAVELL